MLKALMIISTFIFALPDAIASTKVAKVIILKGSAMATSKDGKKTPVKRGTWYLEGDSIETQDKSFVKLLFIDKSQMNLGPNSKMEITKFPKKEAGIINLVKGQLRSKVTKDYMNMNDKDKSKLFIKTKTAAMGVRGTDFQVNFNPENNFTSLITFEGAVAMAQIEINSPESTRAFVSQKALEKVVSSDQAVIVKKGQFSGANPALKRVTLPVKISPAQLNTLEKNESGLGVEKEKSPSSSSNSTGNPKSPKLSKPTKVFRSTIPPGLDSKSAANDLKEVGQAMAKVASPGEIPALTKLEASTPENTNEPPPEGMVDKVTGEVAPPAGGFVDPQTGRYVPPPPGSAFDPVNNVYIPPANVGGIDPATGDFHHPTHELQPDGTFTEKPPEVIAQERQEAESIQAGEGEGPGTDGTIDGERSPASTDDGGDTDGAPLPDGEKGPDGGDPLLAGDTLPPPPPPIEDVPEVLPTFEPIENEFAPPPEFEGPIDGPAGPEGPEDNFEEIDFCEQNEEACNPEPTVDPDNAPEGTTTEATFEFNVN